jgi:hypothetical protein
MNMSFRNYEENELEHHEESSYDLDLDLDCGYDLGSLN